MTNVIKVNVVIRN